VEGILDDPADATRCAEVKPRATPILVTAEGRKDPGDRPEKYLHVLVPELHIDLPFAILDRASCDARDDNTHRAYDATCATAESTENLSVIVERDSLFFRATGRNYDFNRFEELGGVPLPCGTKVRFSTFHRVDRGFSPMGAGK
jgi:hypothetical protein